MILQFIHTVAIPIGLIFTMISGGADIRHAEDDLDALQYSIRDNSELFISGTTNVNSFCCTSRESGHKGTVQYRYSGKDYIDVSEGQLDLTTHLMDCGNKQITKDLHKALRADDYPFIKIQLNALQLQDIIPDKEGWMKALADTDVIIAGCSNHKFIDIQYRILADHVIEAHGATKLCITDFGIDPPKALMGLIKVDDEVEINLRMHIAVDPA